MNNVYEAYCLLGDDTSSQEALPLPGSPPKGSRVCSAKGISRTLPVILCPTSFFGNGFLGVCIFNLRKQFGTQDMTQFAGLTIDEPVPYEWHTAYNGEDQTLVDELWANLQLDVDAGLVALTDDYAKANDLLYAQRSPWQDDMDIYFLNKLHGTHRLRNVRWAFFEYRNEESQSASFHHIKHCMETIRQDLMCFMNDTPPTTGITAPLESGLDQMHMKCIKHSGVTRYKRCLEEGAKYLPETRKYFRLPPDWMLPPLVVIDGFKGTEKFAPENVD